MRLALPDARDDETDTFERSCAHALRARRVTTADDHASWGNDFELRRDTLSDLAVASGDQDLRLHEVPRWRDIVQRSFRRTMPQRERTGRASRSRMAAARHAVLPLFALSTVLVFAACGSDGGASGPGRDDPGGNASSSGGAPSGGSNAGGGSSSGGGATPGEPGKPEVQLIGRFDTRDAAGPKCAWPGCRIVARFDGTEASVEMNEIVETWMDGGPSEWDVAVDGTWRDKLVMKPGSSKYVLATGLAKGPHTVELYKRTDAQNGTTQFVAFDFAGGTLLAPPARKQRRIEIVADSVATGYGVEGVAAAVNGTCPGPGYAARWANFRVSLGARLAETVDAELFGTVHSGKGISRNIWRPDTDTLPVLFERTIPSDATSAWDFSRWSADAVVVMGGGNDFDIGQPTDDGPPSLEQFQTAYAAFVDAIRKHYPQAHLFLTVSPSVSDATPAGRNTRTNIRTGVNAVADAKHAQGDARVYAIEPGAAQPGELTGCDGHGNPAFHERVAKELAAAIRPKLGW